MAACKNHIVKLGNDQQAGYLGVVPVDVTKVRYSWAAPLVAVGDVAADLADLKWRMAGLLFHLVSGNAGQAAQNVTGPVGVFVLLQNVGNFGLVSYCC